MYGEFTGGWNFIFGSRRCSFLYCKSKEKWYEVYWVSVRRLLFEKERLLYRRRLWVSWHRKIKSKNIKSLRLVKRCRLFFAADYAEWFVALEK